MAYQVKKKKASFMFSPPFSIGIKRRTATHTLGHWAPYDTAQGESKETNRLVVHLPGYPRAMARQKTTGPVL